MRKTMPRVVADIDTDLKSWLQHHAIDQGQTMGMIIASLISDYRERVDSPEPTPEPTPKKSTATATAKTKAKGDA